MSSAATGFSSDRRPFQRWLAGANHSPRGCRRVKFPARVAASHDATHDRCTTSRGLICCPIHGLWVPQGSPKSNSLEVLLHTLTSHTMTYLCRSSWWSASRSASRESLVTMLVVAEALGSASCPGPPLTAGRAANQRRGFMTRRTCWMASLGRTPGASPSRNIGTGCRRTRRWPPSRSSARRARWLR